MWFLGAGASAASGVPTASHMVWDFKRTIYAARAKVPLRALGDMGDHSVRLRVQNFFDRAGGYPAENAPEEYAQYFEAAYGNEEDRRRYIQACVEGASPSYGHYALSALMKAERIAVAWTTNFDRLVEDAAAEVFGTTSKLVVAALGEPGIARQAITGARWPLLCKLHGDFHSRRLKNIGVELREQDVQMRSALVEGCRRFGLAIVGYSGRDDSVMNALSETLRHDHPFPFGLYWFHRDDDPLLPRVASLIAEARAAGVQAESVPIETFDELMSDLLLLESGLPAELLALLDAKRPRRLSYVKPPGGRGTWPVLRFNAMEVIKWPAAGRLVRCQIGGSAEVRQAIIASGADVIATRRRAGVICFGRDEDVRAAFGEFGIAEFGLYAIETNRLRLGDSAEIGLLFDALCRALTRELPVTFLPGARKLVVDLAQTDAEALDGLRRVVGSVAGTIAGPGMKWSEAAALRLEYRLDRLFLLINPTVWLHREPGAPVPEPAREFVRQRLASRYNPGWNSILEAWIALLLRGQKEREFRALGIANGVDAVFALSSVTPFSRRLVG